jgi:hypothetical protein
MAQEGDGIRNTKISVNNSSGQPAAKGSSLAPLSFMGCLSSSQQMVGCIDGHMKK